MRIRRILLAASLLLAGPAFGQLPRPGVSIPASKVSISGYTNTDLQSGLSEGEIASIRPAADCTLVDGGKPNEICRDTDDQTLWICTNATECNHADWVAHGGGGGSGDSVFVEGVGATNLDLIGGTTGIDITLNTTPSPDTATFALDWSEITNVVTEASLKAVDSPADEECLTYESGGGGDFEWQTCGGGAAATSLDSSQTGTTYDVKFGSATSPSTGWYYDIDGDGVVDQGEQLGLPNRKIFTVTTMTSTAIQDAIDACGSTVPCEIRLVAGTYPDVCLQIKDKDQGIRIVGMGKGVTTLKPYADLGNCTVSINKETIEINGSDNVEISNLTIDGDKQNGVFDACTQSGGGGVCGTGIFVNSPGGNVSNHPWLHDLEVKNTVNGGVVMTHSNNGIVERVSVTDAGCNQVDSACGCTADPGPCGGWTAASDTGSISGQKTNAVGIQTQQATATNNIIRNNIVTRSSYIGIEAFTNAYNTWIDRNEVTLCPVGITVNGGKRIKITDNYVHHQAQTGGTGDSGGGIELAAAGAENIEITGNRIESNAGPGTVLKPTYPGGVIFSRNHLDSNCTDHVAGAGGDIGINSSGGTPGRDMILDDNIQSGVGCTYGLQIDSTYLGNIFIRGGSYVATTTAASINAPNMFVSGLNLTGNLIFGAAAGGIAMNNTVSGTTTYTAGSKMTTIDDGVLSLSAGTSSGQLQIMEPSASGTNKATFVVPALAADTAYTLPTTDGAASEFLQTNGSGVLTWAAPAGAGTITGVGPAFTTGLSFTDGTASTSNVMLVWEGSTVDTNEFSLLAPCTTCNASDINVTFPSTTGTLVGSGDTGTVTGTMILDADLLYADVYHGDTIAANPGYVSDQVWFGTTGLIFEGPTANLIEGLLTAGPITTTDKTWTLPDVTGTLITTGDTGTVTSTMILDNTVTATDLNATLTFADADLLDLSAVSVSSTTEGIKLPQHATTCASATAEGQICWEADANHLWVGDGAAAVDIGPGGGSGDVTAVGDCASGSCFTGASGTTLTSNTGLILDLDDDNNGTETFTIRDGANATALTVTEAGAATFASSVTASSFTTGASATPELDFDDSVATDSNYESKIVGDAVADDNGSISLQVEDNADGTYKEGFRVFSTAGVTVAQVGNATTNFTVSEAGIMTNTSGTGAGAITLGSTAPQVVLGSSAPVAGKLKLFGTTSGDITVQTAATAGTNTITLPAETGTVLTSAGSSTITGGMLDPTVRTRSAELNILAPVGTEDPLFFRAPYPVTLTRLDCILGGTTSVVVTVNHCDTAGATCAATDLTTTANGGLDSDTDITGAGDETLTAGETLQLLEGTVTGTPTSLFCSVTYTVD